MVIKVQKKIGGEGGHGESINCIYLIDTGKKWHLDNRH